MVTNRQMQRDFLSMVEDIPCLSTVNALFCICQNEKWPPVNSWKNLVNDMWNSPLAQPLIGTIENSSYSLLPHQRPHDHLQTNKPLQTIVLYRGNLVHVRTSFLRVVTSYSGTCMLDAPHKYITLCVLLIWWCLKHVKGCLYNIGVRSLQC